MSVRCDRAKIGVNFFASVCGSALYLAGCILFIPGFETYALVAQSLIIAGSSAVFLSEAAKLYRSGCTSAVNQNDSLFCFHNLFNSIPMLGVDVFAAIGAAFFLIGSVLFLPMFDIDDLGNDRASGIYVCGGVGFTISGLFLLYDHFCARNA
jgi:hypothetical protein